MARALMYVTLCPPCKEISGLAVKGLLGASSHGVAGVAMRGDSSLAACFLYRPRGRSALGVREHCLGRLEVGLRYEDLARACRREILERRVDRLGVAVRAVDAGREEQAADHVGLRPVGHHGQHDA